MSDFLIVIHDHGLTVGLRFLNWGMAKEVQGLGNVKSKIVYPILQKKKNDYGNHLRQRAISDNKLVKLEHKVPM